jgi:hypothetical protein
VGLRCVTRRATPRRPLAATPRRPLAATLRRPPPVGRRGLIGERTRAVICGRTWTGEQELTHRDTHRQPRPDGDSA